MLKLAQLLFFILLGLQLNAQAHYFIYIENSNKQPFTAQVDGKTYEAIAKNFVIIPKLEKGIYNISISTLNATNSKFTVELIDADAGFSLKQNNSNELVLFNINQFNTIEQDGKKVELPKETVVVETKPETSKLPQEKKPEIAEPKVEKEATQEVVTVKPVKRKIKKIYQKKNQDGIDLVYVDINEFANDTISIFVPYKTDEDTPKPLVAIDTAKVDTIKTNITKPQPIDSTPVVANSCLNAISEREVGDFSAKIQETLMLKHKLKLAATVVKEKCFTVNQVKRLGVLFLNETGKLYFYKLAINAVIDTQNFHTLEKEFKDAKLLEEFKALLK